jgi:hypothetical protein
MKQGELVFLKQSRFVSLHLFTKVNFVSREKKKEINILVVGTVRNVSKSIDKEVNNIFKSLEVYGVVDFFLVESDSTDSTLELLTEFQKKETLKFQSLGILEESIPNRIDRIRYCRNIYVDFIRTSEKKYDFIVVADMDGINKGLSRNAFSKVFSEKQEWQMCSANQKFGYYDIYALRASNWSDGDYQKELQNRMSGVKLSYFKEDRLRKSVIYSKMRRVPRSSAWIKVDSAFGGLAVYKPEVFKLFDYSARTCEEFLECEHVTLHRKMNETGMKIFICPEMMNSTFNEYNVNRFALVRVLRYLRKKLRNHQKTSK